MSNLEPRAKIGDVVIVPTNHFRNIQVVVVGAYEADDLKGVTHWSIEFTDSEKKKQCVDEKYILKNLTTNVSYE